MSSGPGGDIPSEETRHEPPGDASVPFYIRLAPFERELINSSYNRFPSWDPLSDETDTVGISLAGLFKNWSWGAELTSLLETDLTPDTVHDDYFDDQKLAFEVTLSSLKNGKFGERTFRTSFVVPDNPSFIAGLGHIDTGQLVFQMHPDDIECWQRLAMMALEAPVEMSLWTHLMQPKPPGESLDLEWGNYEIWKVLRRYSIRRRRQSNDKLVDEFIKSETFRSHYIIRRPPIPVGVESPLKWRWSLNFLPKLPGDRMQHQNVETNVDSEDSDSLSLKPDQMADLLRSFGRRGSLESPYYYMEYIPWSELEPLSPACHLEDTLAVTFSEGDWVLWNSGNGDLYDHHLFTEEECFQYCITNSWVYPGHSVGMRTFWHEWNDCAFTKRPSDGQLVLLETAPGRQYRRLQRQHDTKAARIFYREVVNEHAAGATLSVRNALGLDYDPRLLRFIPPEQLEVGKYLGKGKFAVVYGGIWKRPLSFGRPLAETTPVALKMHVPSASSSDPTSQKKVLKELDATYFALSGKNICCVEFYGVTRLKLTEDGRLLSPSASDILEPPTTDVLCLVLQLASEGSMHDFFVNKLEIDRPMEAWSMVVNALLDIANALDSIHAHSVLHRDLHLNNILVTYEYFPIERCGKWKFLLADLGEGKRLDSDDSGAASQNTAVRDYGNINYRAPEIKDRGSGHYTTKADIYSFGKIGMALVRICAGTKMMPVGLDRLLRRCTRAKPSERPDARKLAFKLEEICDFQGGELAFQPYNEICSDYEGLEESSEEED